MKKSFKVLSGAMLLSFMLWMPFYSNANDSEDTEEVDGIVEDIIEMHGGKVHCRCKHGGCFAGYWLSFRSLCANVGEEDCPKFKANCPE